jgi:carboxyl-terminal processing protease
VQERSEYAQKLLKQDFDFSVREDYVFDRSEGPWATSRAELDDIWRRRVKNDMLTLRLAGKQKPEEIQETLSKRYQRLLTSTTQLKSSDVHQFFMNAYTGSIDPHTDYFTPRASENFEIRMSLSLEGIGAVLQSESDYTLVRSLVPGGPADRSKELHPQDRITAVGEGENGELTDVIGWRLDDVVDLIRGRPGSQVRLQGLR